jgi:hypothetical protein|tara:strand:+ start:727 stop:1314 length:588 start_codon:yes stop_codon:yes gene_type:complete
MSTPIDLFRQEFEKNRYNRNIDTSFSQFVAPTLPSASAPPSVQEFFQYYQQLFYVIPKEGDITSHRYLINTSEAYIGASEQSDELRALQEEITQLRVQLLQAQTGPAQAIVDTLSASNLNLPELPEVPNLDIPSSFNTNISGGNQLGDNLSSAEKRKRRAAAKKELARKLEEQKLNRPPDKDNLDRTRADNQDRL